MKLAARLGVLLATCSLPLAAQTDQAPELGRLQRTLQQSRGEVDRLLDLRMRHDLGLPVQDPGELFKPEGPVTGESLTRARAVLQNEEIATNNLLQRCERLKAQAAQLQADAKAQVEQSQQGEWVTVPRAGTATPRQPQPRPPAPAAASEQPSEAPPPPVMAVLPNLGAPRGQIHGSKDHALVAAALYRAAEALIERGEQLRQHSQEALAKQCDDEAKDRFERALDALAAALEAQPNDFAVLFCKGKCLEQLFRLSERYDDLDLGRDAGQYQKRAFEVRAPWVAVQALDVGRDGKELGSWGRAAKTAIDHFEWINLNGGFKPRIPLESITWEPRQQ